MSTSSAPYAPTAIDLDERQEKLLRHVENSFASVGRPMREVRNKKLTIRASELQVSTEQVFRGACREYSRDRIALLDPLSNGDPTAGQLYRAGAVRYPHEIQGGMQKGRKYNYAAVYSFTDRTSYFDMLHKMSAEMGMASMLVGSLESKGRRHPGLQECFSSSCPARAKLQLPANTASDWSTADAG